MLCVICLFMSNTIRSGLPNFLRYISLSLCLALLSACATLEPLPQGGLYLHAQKVKGAPTPELSEQLDALLPQQPNRRLPLLGWKPYLWAYSLGKLSHARTGQRHADRMRAKLGNYERQTSDLRARQQSLKPYYDSLALQKARSYRDAARLQGELLALERHYVRDSLRMLQQLRRLRLKSNKQQEELERYTAEGNWLMASVGEPPAIYDAQKNAQAVQQMQRYLHARGYRQASLQWQVDTLPLGRAIRQRIRVQAGQPTRMRVIEYVSADTVLRNELLQTIGRTSLLRQDELLDEELLSRERDRLSDWIQNRGYYAFNPSYIRFELDTGAAPGYADVQVRIVPPQHADAHTRYRVQEVQFQIEEGGKGAQPDTLRYRGMTFIGGSFSPRALSSKIALQPGSPYSLRQATETRTVLGNMDVFKFVNLSFEDLGQGRLRANLFATPYDRYQTTFETGLNVLQTLPGPFASWTLKVRNVFGGGDVLQFQGRFLLEAQAGLTTQNNSLYNGQEYGANLSWTVPKVLLPVPRSWKERFFSRDVRTQVLLGPTFIKRPEYSRFNMQTSFGYQWRNHRNDLFNLSLIDLSVIRTPYLSKEFEIRLRELADQGNTLKYSFENTFVSSVNGSYVRNLQNYGRGGSRGAYIKFFAEYGGSYLDLLRLFSGQQAPENPDYLYGFRLFRFAKLSVDMRKMLPTSRGGQLVSRLFVGVATPFSSNDPLPYEKYFFTGGGNSNRAWRARRIGPGSYTPPINQDGTYDYRFEQPGELLIEANLEWRQKLAGMLHLALFVDASNVWMLQEDPSRPGAKFEVRDFWKEFAVGVGAGLRMDFNYVVMRFDVGLKMFDPARPLGQRFVGGYQFFGKGQAEYNISIGYPF